MVSSASLFVLALMVCRLCCGSAVMLRSLSVEDADSHRESLRQKLSGQHPYALQQDPSGNPSGISTNSGAFPPDDVSNNNDDNVLQCLIPEDRVERSTQTSGSVGPLLPPSARAAYHSDRSRSPFHFYFVHFRPASWPKGLTSRKSN